MTLLIHDMLYNSPKHVRRMENKEKSVIVLLSGGIDSAACLKYYLDQDFDMTAVFINYGQRAKTFELKSAKKIAKFYNIKLAEISLQSKKLFFSGEILGRNALLVLIVIMIHPKYKGLISLGIHSGTPYYDCSEEFVNLINDLLKGYSNGEILLDAPFLKWNKNMIIQYCKDHNVPIDLTYSCENGEEHPCGRCLSCLDRRILNVC